MDDIGTAYVRIAPNMTGIQGKIAAGMKGAGSEATKQLGSEIDSHSGPFQSALSKLGGVAKAGGLAIASGIAAGAVGIATLASKMALSGAQLEQQLGGSEAVFGQYAKNIQNVALNAYTKMGLSQNEFLAGANKMGSLYQGAGFDVQKSMEMSVDAIQRATDVASIMGIDTTTALESVTAMAKGNFTMMDNLGVAINDTTIAQFALSKGINKSTTEMTTQEKVGLATQLFLEKTAKFAGNYAKENETLAGSLNTTKKAFEDFVSGGNTIDNFINSLIKTIQIAVPQILKILPQIVAGLGQLVSSLGPVIADVLPRLVPAIVQAALGLMLALVDQLPTIIKVLVSALPQFIDGFVQIFMGIVEAMPEIVKILTAAIPQIVDALVTALTEPERLMTIIEGGITLLMALIEAIPVIIGALVAALPRIVTAIIATLTNGGFLSRIAEAGVKMIGQLISGILQMVGAVGQAAWRIITAIGEALSPNNLVRIGGDLVRGLWNGISNLSGWIVDKVKGFGKGVLDGIKGFFGIKSPSTVFADVGRDLDRGLAVGVTKNAGIVTKAIDSMASDALTSMAGIDSSLAAGFNSSVNMQQSIRAGEFEAAPKVVQNNTFNVNEQMDVQKIASDLGYAVSQA